MLGASPSAGGLCAGCPLRPRLSSSSCCPPATPCLPRGEDLSGPPVTLSFLEFPHSVSRIPGWSALVPDRTEAGGQPTCGHL